MLFRISFLLFVAFSQILSAQNVPKTLEVRWGMNSDFEYILLSEKILKAIEQEKVTAYDKSWKPIPPKNIVGWIEERLKEMKTQEGITLEEASIALANGDLSVLRTVKSTLSLEEISQLSDKGYSQKNFDEIFKTLYFRTTVKNFNCLYAEMVEKIVLDTTKTKQIGEFQYLLFSLDSIHNFRIQYLDFLKLDFKKEIKTLQEHTFDVSNFHGGLVILVNDSELSFQHQFKREEAIDLNKLNQTLFRYFRSQVGIYDFTTGRRIKW